LLFLQASLSNIPPKSALLVVHVISVWVMSLFTWWVRTSTPIGHNGGSAHHKMAHS
jgi:hypothetical protein